jgi:hypothetical protein
VSVSERYVELSLRLARHDEELLDFYFGPTEIAERVEREPLPEPTELAEDARSLADETDSAYMRAQLRGLEIVARKLAGEQLSYEDEMEGCYGTRAERVPEERFEEAHRALDELLPPGGTLPERYQRWEDGDPLPAERLESVLQAVAEALRGTTRDAHGLPDEETFDVELVSGKHWYAFNDYRGGFRSRVEVNTDLPISAGSVVALMAHELYPGHHTERAWKEQLLYLGAGQLEESVLVYGTPQSVITEGIAVLAVDHAVNEHGALLRDVFGGCGVDYDPESHRRIRAVNRVLEASVANAAILLHVDGVSLDEVAVYLQRWELASEERARQQAAFVMDRWGRAYIRTYIDGYELCKRWVGGDPQRFKRLLTEQLTPADLT